MFIDRRFAIPGNGVLPDIELAPIKLAELSGLPSPVHKEVTQFLTPKLVDLVKNICSADPDAFHRLSTSNEMAFWGIYSQEQLLAMTGLFSITKEGNQEVQARSFCGIFNPKNFGLRIASRVMPVRSWYGLRERRLNMITSYVAEENVHSLRAVTQCGYTVLGKAMVPYTDLPGIRLAQFNPDLGLDTIQERAAEEAAVLGSDIDAEEVERSYRVTLAHLERVEQTYGVSTP